MSKPSPINHPSDKSILANRSSKQDNTTTETIDQSRIKMDYWSTVGEEVSKKVKRLLNPFNLPAELFGIYKNRNTGYLRQDFTKMSPNEIAKLGDLSDACLIGSHWQGVSWKGAKFARTNWYPSLGEKYLLDARANISGADFENGDFKFADLRGIKTFDPSSPTPRVNLRNADLSYANLSGHKLAHLDLTGANLEGANLINVDFADAMLEGANFNNVWLGAILFNKAKVPLNVIMKYAKKQELSRSDIETLIKNGITNLHDVVLAQGVDLRGLGLSDRHVIFKRAEMPGAILSGEDLRNVSLQESNLENAKLNDTNLSRNQLWSTNLNHADLNGARVDATDFASASMIGIDLNNFDIHAAKLDSAILNSEDSKSESLAKFYSKSKLNVEDFKNLLAEGIQDFSDLEFEEECDFSELDLSEYKKLNFTKTKLAKANLAGQNLSHIDLTKTELKDANLNNAHFLKASDDQELNKCLGRKLASKSLSKNDILTLTNPQNEIALGIYYRNLDRANISGEEFNYLDLRDINLTKTSLEGAMLNYVDLSNNRTLSNAKLAFANIKNSKLNNTDLKYSDLRSTKFLNSQLKEVNLEYAKFDSTVIETCDINGITLNIKDLGQIHIKRPSALFNSYSQIFTYQPSDSNLARLLTGATQDRTLLKLIKAPQEARPKIWSEEEIKAAVHKGRKDFSGEIFAPEVDLRGLFKKDTAFNFEGTVMIGAKLDDCKLSKSNFLGADLRSASLTHAILDGANINQALLYDANLQGASLKEASLNEAVLSNANLSCVKLNWASLIKTNLDACNLHKTNLSNANIEDCYFSSDNKVNSSLNKYFSQQSLGSNDIKNLLEIPYDLFTRHFNDFSYCNIRANANLADLELSRKQAKFCNANLAQAILPQDLSEVNLQGANLKEAQLEGTRISGNYNIDAILAKYLSQKALTAQEVKKLVSFYESEISLQNSKIFDPNIGLINLVVKDGENLSGIFNGKNLVLTGASFVDCDLSNEDLRQIKLKNSNLKGTNFTAANLNGTDLSLSYLKGANFSLASTKNINLNGAVLYENDNLLNHAPQIEAINQALTPPAIVNALKELIDKINTLLEQEQNSYRAEDLENKSKLTKLKNRLEKAVESININDYSAEYIFDDISEGLAQIIRESDLDISDILGEDLKKARIEVSNSYPVVSPTQSSSKTSFPLKETAFKTAASLLLSSILVVQATKITEPARDPRTHKVRRNNLPSIVNKEPVTQDQEIKNIQTLIDNKRNNLETLTRSELEQISTAKNKYKIEFNLSGLKCTNLDLKDIDLSNLNLAQVDFSNSNLMGANLHATNLQGAILKDTKLMFANLSNTKCNGATFDNTQLQNANLKEASLEDLVLANMLPSNFRGTKIDDPYKIKKLSQKEFENYIKARRDTYNSVDFEGYDLRNIKFKDLENMDLRGANLTGVDFHNLQINNIDFSNALLTNANFEDSVIKNCNFIEAKAQKANFANSFHLNCDLSNASLEESDFSSANIGSNHFDNANLNKAKLIFSRIYTESKVTGEEEISEHLLKANLNFAYTLDPELHKIQLDRIKAKSTKLDNINEKIKEHKKAEKKLINIEFGKKINHALAAHQDLEKGSKDLVNDLVEATWLTIVEARKSGFLSYRRFNKVASNTKKYFTLANKVEVNIPDVIIEFAEIIGRAIKESHGKDKASFTKELRSKLKPREGYRVRVNLSRLDLRDVNFQQYKKQYDKLRIDCSQSNLDGLNLSDLNLYKASFDGASLYKTDFSKAELKNAFFDRSILDGTIFNDAKLDKALFQDTHVDYCKFKKAFLIGTRFYNSSIRHTWFDNAHLNRTEFLSSFIVYSGFRDADLNNAIYNRDGSSGSGFIHCFLGEAKNFDRNKVVIIKNKHTRKRKGMPSARAIIKGLKRFKSRGHPIDLRNFDLRGFIFPPEYNYSDAKFMNSDLSYATFARRVDGSFFKFNLSGANFENSILDGAKLLTANLCGANLKNTSLKKTSFLGSNLQESDFRGTDLSSTFLGMTSNKGAKGLEKLSGNKPYTNVKNRVTIKGKISPEQLQKKIMAERPVNLSGYDLSNIDFNQMGLNYRALREANFRGSKLTGAIFSGFNLEYADFRDTELSNAQFQSLDRRYITRLDFANFKGAKFNKTNMTNARIASTVIEKAKRKDIIGANFTFAKEEIESPLHRSNVVTSRKLQEIFELNYEDAKDIDLSKKDLTGIHIPYAEDTIRFLRNRFRRPVRVDLSGADLVQAQILGGSRNPGKKVNLGMFLFKKANLSSALLKDLKFQRLSTRSKKFEQDFRETNFNETVFDNVEIRSGNLERASFKDADLSKSPSIFVNCNLKAVNFEFANLNGVYLGLQDLSGSKFNGSKLQKTIFLNSTLDHCQFLATDMRTAKLKGANIRNSLFVQADLRANQSLQGNDLSRSVFNATQIQKSNLSGANLNHSRFNVSRASNANLSNANLTSATSVDSSFEETNFKDANLSGALLINNHFGRANLEGANLSNINSKMDGRYKNSKSYQYNNFHSANLRNANLQKAHLAGSDFSYADLRGADLRGADLRGANFVYANLEGADLRGAILDSAFLDFANLKNAKLQDTRFINPEILSKTKKFHSIDDIKDHLKSLLKNYRGSKLHIVKKNEIPVIDVKIPFYESDVINAINQLTKALEKEGFSCFVARNQLTNRPFSSRRTRVFTVVNLRELCQGASFNHTDLEGVDLSEADLRNADLSKAKMQNLKAAYKTNFSGAKLSAAGLKGQNFTRAQFVNSKIIGEDLSEVNLSHADFSNVDLSKKNLTKANLTEAKLDNTKITAANFSHAQLKKVDLKTTKINGKAPSFYGATLDEAKLDNNDFNGVDFRSTSFKNASLVKTNLSKSKLSAADFSGANIDQTDFHNAHTGPEEMSQNGIASLPAATFHMTKNRYSAKFDQGNIPETEVKRPQPSLKDKAKKKYQEYMNDVQRDYRDFLSIILALLAFSSIAAGKSREKKPKKIQLKDFTVRPALRKLNKKQLKQLLEAQKANFSNLVIENPSEDELNKLNDLALGQNYANFANSKLRRVDLSNVKDLYKVNFTGADLQESNLSGSNIEGGELFAADLERADLSRTDLQKANLRNANLEGANLKGANIRDAHFDGARLKGAIFTGDPAIDRIITKILTQIPLNKTDLINYLKSGYSNLRGAVIKGIDFREFIGEGARYPYVSKALDLSKSKLYDCEFDNLDLAGYNLAEAQFLGRTSMKGAKLDKANTFNTYFPIFNTYFPTFNKAKTKLSSLSSSQKQLA